MTAKNNNGNSKKYLWRSHQHKLTMKLANYSAINYTYCHEALEITSNSKAFSKIEHFSIEK